MKVLFLTLIAISNSESAVLKRHEELLNAKKIEKMFLTNESLFLFDRKFVESVRLKQIELQQCQEFYQSCKKEMTGSQSDVWAVSAGLGLGFLIGFFAFR